MESNEQIKLAKGALRITRNATLLSSVAMGSQILCSLSGNIIVGIIFTGIYGSALYTFLKEAMMKHKIYKDFEIECAVGLKEAIDIHKGYFKDNALSSFMSFVLSFANLYSYSQDENMARALPITLWLLCGLGYGTAAKEYGKLQKQLKEEQEKVKTLN